MDRNYVKEVAVELLGRPTQKSSKELRWGRRGSLSVSLEAGKFGYWYDHEVGEGGGFNSLVARKTGFRDHVQAIEWSECRPALSAVSEAGIISSGRGHSATTEWNGNKAIIIWKDAFPLSGTPGEIYLRTRALSNPGCHCCRFHPRCPVTLSNGQKSYQPALISLFRDTRSDAPVAILRTFLKTDGYAKSDHPLLKNQKQMLGSTTGAAIKITPDENVNDGLVIAEGLETSLSVAASGWAPVWALGSAAAIARFVPMPGIQALTIMADADTAGVEAAKRCAQRWLLSGVEVTILVPKRGGDWNDWITEKI